MIYKEQVRITLALQSVFIRHSKGCLLFLLLSFLVGPTLIENPLIHIGLSFIVFSGNLYALQLKHTVYGMGCFVNQIAKILVVKIFYPNKDCAIMIKHHALPIGIGVYFKRNYDVVSRPIWKEEEGLKK